MRKKTLLSWSSGKDSAWTLYTLQRDPNIELAGLFCTVNRRHDRVAMHGVRVDLLQQQAARAGLPLHILEIPDPCSNEEYEAVMNTFVEQCRADAIECFAFGDLYLQDIRDYRIDKLRNTGIEALFPIWGLPTRQLAQEMIESGLKAVLTCVDTQQIPAAFAGHRFDRALLDSLPKTADPCGEQGEFHSFVFDGPMFDRPIAIEVGDILQRDDRFVFADVTRSQ